MLYRIVNVHKMLQKGDSSYIQILNTLGQQMYEQSGDSRYFQHFSAMLTSDSFPMGVYYDSNTKKLISYPLIANEARGLSISQSIESPMFNPIGYELVSDQASELVELQQRNTLLRANIKLAMHFNGLPTGMFLDNGSVVIETSMPRRVEGLPVKVVPVNMETRYDKCMFWAGSFDVKFKLKGEEE